MSALNLNAGARRRRPARTPFRDLFACLFFTGTALVASGAEAGPVSANAKYVVSLAGINFASVGIDFETDNRTYAVEIDANVSGVGKLVANGTAVANSEGVIAASSLSPKAFSIETRASRETFNVDVQYAGGNTEGFKVEPPVLNTIGRVALERRQLRGVTDPIASFIVKATKLDASICNRKLKIFSGMERYDISMQFAELQEATSTRTGYQGPVVLCQMHYQPISGHYEQSEMTAYLEQSDRLLIWYAPLGDTGYYVPYRVLMGTAAGDLSMVLTGLTQTTDVAAK